MTTTDTQPILIDFLRHGECKDNAFLRGRTDSSLSDTGHAKMAKALAGQHYQSVYSSPRQRCLSFAKDYTQQHQLPLKTEQDWQERNFGDWDGQSLQQLQALYPEMLADYFERPFTFKIPKAESLIEFSNRIDQAWLYRQQTSLQLAIQSKSQAQNQSKNQNTLIITHGGCIRRVLQNILAMDDSGLFHLDIPYACRVRIQVYPTVQNPFAKLIGIYPL